MPLTRIRISRIDFFELRPIESPLLQNAQAVVFDENVGFLNQLGDQLAAFGRLHVHGERFLAALEFHEVRIFVPLGGIFAAVAVAAQPSFAADHLRAELAEHPRHGGARGAGGELNDAYAFQG